MSPTKSKIKSNEAYFPVVDVRPAEAGLREFSNHLDLIGAPELHGVGLTGTGIVMGVVDSGTSPGQHDDLKSWVRTELDVDVHGHGTHVASIMKKICPDARLISAKAMNRTGGGNIKDIEAGTLWLIESGCNVINGSFAFNETTSADRLKTYIDVINFGVSKGVVFCFASGNEGAKKVSFPSNRDNVFSVGAINARAELADFSNRGHDIDVVAPGKDIPGQALNGGVVVMSGTSQAAPHATAMMALYMQYVRDKEGALPDFFRAYSDITKTSTQDLGPRGFDDGYGYGLIKPYFAGIGTHVVRPRGFMAWLWRFLGF